MVDIDIILESFSYNEKYREKRSLREMQEEDLSVVTLSDKSYLIKKKKEVQEIGKNESDSKNKKTRPKKSENSKDSSKNKRAKKVAKNTTEVKNKNN